MHDGTVSLDWPPNDIVIVLQVDDYNFGGCGSRLRLADAYEGIGFEGLDGEQVSMRVEL